MALAIDRYRIQLTLLRDILATNPADTAVMDTHVIERQRKLILEKSAINTEINKYLNASPISDARKSEEIKLIGQKLSELMGMPLSPDQEGLLAAGKLEELRETFADLDTKGTTVFFQDDKTGRPMIGDHMIYGFMKAAAEAIGRTLPRKNSTMLQSISYTQSIINQHARVEEPFITFDKDSVKDASGKPIYLQRSLRAETAQGPRISLAKSERILKGAKLDFTMKVLAGSPLTEEVIRKLFDYGEIVGLGQWRNSGRGMFAYEMQRIEERR